MGIYLITSIQFFNSNSILAHAVKVERQLLEAERSKASQEGLGHRLGWRKKRDEESREAQGNGEKEATSAPDRSSELEARNAESAGESAAIQADVEQASKDEAMKDEVEKGAGSAPEIVIK